MNVLVVCFFFFKQKTAYEMRISDWSSDVCSSDLLVLMATTPSVNAPGIGWAALRDDDMLASGLKLPTATPLGLAYQAAAMAGWTSAAMLPSLKNVPTLILMGERDGVVPACHGQSIADLIDGAYLETMPGSHLFPFPHAAKVAAPLTALHRKSDVEG